MSSLDPAATITSAFSIAELVRQVNANVRQIAGGVPVVPKVIAIGSWDSRGPEPMRDAPPDPTWEIGPGQPKRAFDLALEGGRASVLVTTAFSLNEYRGGSQWNVWVSADNDPASFVLAFAAVAAAAEIGRGRVWDGDGVFGPEADDGLAPRDVIDLLTAHGPHGSFLAACKATMSRISMS